MNGKKPTEKQRKNSGNLKPFVKGQSGNPGGRPKGSLSITKHLRAALAAQDEEQAKVLAQAIIEQAMTGNSQALKTVMDRIDGPVKEEVDVNVSELTHEQRMDRLAALLGAARARRDGRDPDGGSD